MDNELQATLVDSQPNSAEKVRIEATDVIED